MTPDPQHLAAFSLGVIIGLYILQAIRTYNTRRDSRRTRS